jgi:hypothetical protein
MITSNAPDSISPSKTPKITKTQEMVISPTEGNTTPMIQPMPTSSNYSLQNLIEKAKDDLAQRLSIPITQINLIEALEVEWSDSSLGCPQPDMFYTQVITPGYRILLEANARVYEYHSNRDTYVIYCENSNPLISPPKP